MSPNAFAKNALAESDFALSKTLSKNEQVSNEKNGRVYDRMANPSRNEAAAPLKQDSPDKSPGCDRQRHEISRD